MDNAISMLDAVYAGYENGDYSYEEAETRGADLLREQKCSSKEEHIGGIWTMRQKCFLLPAARKIQGYFVFTAY